MEQSTLNEHTKKNFFPKDNTLECNKEYFMSANIKLSTDARFTTYTGIFFHFCIKRIEDNLHFTIELYSLSYDKQKQTSLENSFWNEERFGAGKYIPIIVNYYSDFIKNFYLYLDENIHKVSELKELIEILENPTYSFYLWKKFIIPKGNQTTFFTP